MNNRVLYFISKDAAWQDYRNEILTKLGQKFDIKIEILTTGKLKPYLKENDYLKYRKFRNWIPQKLKASFFPGALIYILIKKPQVVLCLDNVTQFTEYFAFLLCKITGIRFVWWTHGDNPTREYKSQWLRKIRQRYAIVFLRKGDTVITFSEHGKKYLIRERVAKDKIICAPNTLDTDKLFKLSKLNFTKEEIIKSLSLPASGQFILFMGRILKEKKVDHLIQAMPIILKKIPDLYLIIIGDGKYKNKLLRLTDSLKLKSVIFAGPVFDDRLKAKYFKISKLFIIPGYVGLAIVYAFCFGLPIITGKNNNHAPEIKYLNDGQNGYFVDADNIEELASKIIDLLSNLPKLKQFSDNAIDTIIKEANVNLMIERMGQALGLNNNQLMEKDLT